MKRCLLKDLSLGIMVSKKDHEFYYEYGKLGIIKNSYFHDIEDDSWYLLRTDESKNLNNTIKVLEPNLEKYINRLNIKNDEIDLEELKKLIKETYSDLEFEDKTKCKEKMLRK